MRLFKREEAAEELQVNAERNVRQSGRESRLSGDFQQINEAPSGWIVKHIITASYKTRQDFITQNTYFLISEGFFYLLFLFVSTL